MLFNRNPEKLKIILEATLSFVANVLVDEKSRAIFKKIFSLFDRNANGQLDEQEIYDGFTLIDIELELL